MLFRIVLVLVTAWRAFVAFRFDLCSDEVYYFYWSLSPRAGYLDHPPLTAWLMALSGRLLGENVLSVRLWPLLGGVALPLAGRALARRMFDARTGDRAGLLLVLAPVFIGNGLLMTPDALLIPCWTGALYAAWRAVEERRASSPWWVVAGLAAGAGLLSKYTMVLLFPALALLALVTPGRRRELLAGGAIAGGVALLCFAPVILWNARHDWVSFRYQLGHGAEATGRAILVNLGGYAGGLLGVVTPLLGGACFVSASRGPGDPRRRFLGAVFWTVVLFFGAFALRSRVEANWPVAAFVPGLILVAADWPGFPRGWRRATAGLLVAADLAAMTYFALPKEKPLSLLGFSLDLQRMEELAGAGPVADAVRNELAATKADFVCVDGYQLFARLAFYAPELRSRLVLEPEGWLRFPWVDARRWEGRTALLVSEFRDDRPGFAPFRTIRPLRTARVPFRGTLCRELRFSVGEGYLPSAPPQAAP